MNKPFDVITVWKLQLNNEQREQIPNIVSSGNRYFPYS